jgi:hypothetical protein
VSTSTFTLTWIQSFLQKTHLQAPMTQKSLKVKEGMIWLPVAAVDKDQTFTMMY